jgi:hypothetical protein
MNPQPNPDERFDQVESTLNRLANSQRHLLTAQVLMNERMDRSERAIQNLAEQTLKLAGTVQALADGQKHTDSKLDALADIVRQWIERNGNGGGRHSAS